MDWFGSGAPKEGDEELGRKTPSGDDRKEDEAPAATLEISRTPPSPESVRALAVELDYPEICGLRFPPKLLPKGWESVEAEDKVGQVKKLLAETIPDHNFPDHRILRNIIGMELDVQLSLQRLIEIYEWRKENNMEDVRARALELGPDNLPNKNIVQQVMQHTPHFAYTKDGSPVGYFECSADIEKAKEFDNEEIKALGRIYFLHSNEYLATLCDRQIEATGVFTSIFHIYNLQGVGMTHVWNKGVLQRFLEPLLKEASHYCIESVRCYYMLNAPLLFRGLWAIIGLLLNQRQKDKNRMRSDNALEELQGLIELIPTAIGGTLVLPDLERDWTAEAQTTGGQEAVEPDDD